MTREQAQREARKRWGARAVIRVGQHLSDVEKREAAMQTVRTARARRDAIDAEIKDRLNALDWYQQLQAERRECITAIRAAQGWGTYYKFEVGKNCGIGWMVEGQGDTWEQAFEKADAKGYGS